MFIDSFASIAAPDLQPVFDALSATPLSRFVRESEWAFPAIESAHVVAIALVVGMITIVDLRLLGLASARAAYTDISAAVLPWTWGAFTLAALSGTLMFISQPGAYWENLAFRMKIGLLFFAGANVLFFHLVTCRDVSRWNHESSAPLPARLAAMLSLALWIAVVFLGRWIGFTMTPA